MDPDCLIRILELVHAIKVFISAANRLKDEDMEHLDKIANLLERKGGKPKVNKAQFEKAEPIMQQIRNLKDLKGSFNMPPECYSIVFRLASGRETIANNTDLGPLSMHRLISNFQNLIDEQIEKLEKELEEI